MKNRSFSIVFLCTLAFALPAAASAITPSQVSAILSLLQAFDADKSVITSVQVALSGTPKNNCPSLTRSLYRGLTDIITGGEISTLQRFLARDASVYPEGLVTGYFGPATEAAVQRWQSAHGLLSFGSVYTNGFGGVGPKTRAAIAEVCSRPVTNAWGTTASTTAATATIPDSVTRNTPVGTGTTNRPARVRPTTTIATLQKPELSSSYKDWLVRKVCADSSDRPVPTDPYDGCPSGTTMRQQKMGDPLPYHIADLPGEQRADAWWTYDKDMNPYYFHTFDYTPFNQYNLFSYSDGHDSYSIKNGWVSIADTRDGGGYGTTWWGSGCTVGGGWVLFPTSNFLSGGSATLPIGGTGWEQEGQTAPGVCGGQIQSLTTWELKNDFSFGGADGQPVKTMDTLVSYHGNATDDHLEIFYFTQIYGPTRWETWRPANNNPAKSLHCASADIITYQGKQWVMTDCREWTRVTLATPSDVVPPVWPLPLANILLHWHWDNDWQQSWQKGGTASDGGPMNWTMAASTYPQDTGSLYGYSLAGTHYLLTNCGVLSNSARCGWNGSYEQLWQDLPASQFVSGTTYVFGIDARTVAGTGSLVLGLQQLDATKTRVIDQINAYLTVESSYDNARSDSVYNNTKFLYGKGKVDLHPETQYMRYVIVLGSPETFQILDAWLFAIPDTLSLSMRH